ncbi:MAG: hypothetical protein MUF45_13750 [Spirosomaceae bacterium]|jgi:hypothetical protein|nr:hypothetical protein [Spirosomataceae bacterium]
MKKFVLLFCIIAQVALSQTAKTTPIRGELKAVLNNFSYTAKQTKGAEKDNAAILTYEAPDTKDQVEFTINYLNEIKNGPFPVESLTEEDIANAKKLSDVPFYILFYAGDEARCNPYVPIRASMQLKGINQEKKLIAFEFSAEFGCKNQKGKVVGKTFNLNGSVTTSSYK